MTKNPPSYFSPQTYLGLNPNPCLREVAPEPPLSLIQLFMEASRPPHTHWETEV